MNEQESGQPAVDTSIEYKSTTQPVEQPKTESVEPEPSQEAPKGQNDEGSETAKDEPKKKRNGYKEKASRYKNENEFLKSELAKYIAPKPEQPTAQSNPASDNGEPQVENFENFLEYNKAQTKWQAQEIAKSLISEEFGNRDKQAQEYRVQQDYVQKVQTYESKMEPILAQMPDFTEKTDQLYEAGIVKPGDPLEMAVLESEIGPQITLHLLQNPNELMDLVGKSEGYVNRMIGKLEARLENSQAPAVRTTKAPPPIVPVKSQANPSSVKPEEMDQDAYEKWRFGDRLRQ